MIKRVSLLACGTGLAAVMLQLQSSSKSTAGEYKERLAYRAYQASTAASALWRTVNDTATAVLTRSNTASGAWAGSLAGQVADWAEDHVKHDVVVLLGGYVLLEWLLDSAIGKRGPDDQQHAERAIISFLHNEATSSLLLQQSGAVPRLLQLVAQSSHMQEAADAVSRAARSVSLSDAASLDDIRDTLAQVNGKDGPRVRQLAVQYIGNWADNSLINCGKIAAMGGGPVLAASLLDADAQGPTSEDQQADILHAMAVLARDCPLRQRLELDRWLQPILYVAADAAAERQWALAAQALDAFSACVQHGTQLEAALADSNAFALLRQLANEKHALMQRAVMTAVASLAAAPGEGATGSLLPASQMAFWDRKLLQCVCGEAADLTMCANASAALEALVQMPGAQGMLLAADWLGDIMVHLAQGVQAYHSLHMEHPGRDEVAQSTYASAVAVLPAYARGVAAELRSLWMGPEEVPADADTPLPLSVLRPQKHSASFDTAALDLTLSKALKVLCALVSSSDDRQRWLFSAGILPLLQRLTVDSGLEGSQQLSAHLQRQVARLLAMITAHIEAPQMRMTAWEAWLEEAAQSPDCKLSSHATRALLHLHSARAAAAVRAQDPFGNLDYSGSDAASHRKAERLVYRDGVHLFSPLADHHRVLAEQGSSASTPGSPLLDIVFVHGIRGGPFASWRSWDPRAQAQQPRGRLVHDRCWPSAWLASDMPDARLLSMEYAAPASGWEGESLPLWGTVEQLIDRLTAAGIGKRPVVFIAHSMGGILVKELLVKAAQPNAPAHHKQLAAAASGLVFYCTPHMGSWMAAWGWNLRYFGASPAASVLHLKPGPHLEEVNNALRTWHSEGRLPVLSFGEGKALSIGGVLPRMVVVPPEAAQPGYGTFTLLQEADHIDACKPRTPDEPAYALTLRFLQQCLAPMIRRRACLDSNEEQRTDLPPAG